MTGLKLRAPLQPHHPQTVMNSRDLLPGVPLIESPFFEQFAEQTWPDAELRRVATDLHRDGYAVIEFPEPDFSSIAAKIRSQLTPGFNLPEWQRDGAGSLRVQDAWKQYEEIRRLAAHPRILDLLSALYGRRAWPFQTLNFPVGTQQPAHTDAVHFSSVPERFMCGVWIALEDIHDDAGPLEYYPGSHRWPMYGNDQLGLCAADHGGPMGQLVYEPLWRELVKLHGLQAQRFTAREGQALIWTANLLHGGAAQNDRARTRWSQVTHYYFDDCIWYTPMGSDPMYGNVLFREPVDIATGAIRRNTYQGREVAIDRVGRAFAAPAAQPRPSIWSRIKSKLRAG